jgi:hypothetical protein
MNHLIRAGRVFFAIGLAGIGGQQFQYAEFRPVIFPAWPAGWQYFGPGAYLVGLLLVVAALIILIKKNAEKVCLLLGACFLIFFIALHSVSLIFFNPYSFHLGSWTDALKELAFAGGSFVLAGSYVQEFTITDKNSPLYSFLEKLIPAGTIFFSVMMVCFGIDHFLYTDFVATLVPAWIPGHVFWTYFAGIALIGSGLGMMLKIKPFLVAWLTGWMLFLWFIVLHIPRAITDPHMAKGNEVTSVFEALAFSGIAFVVAGMQINKRPS